MIAIYPGSFDPVTLGHVDIIKRALSLTDVLIVAVLKNSSKNALFTVEERISHLELLTKDMPNVKVDSFSGLLVDFAQKHNAKFIIRGLRALTDFEFEFQMALTNRELNSDIETILIPTSLQYLYISSRVVKEVAHFGGDISTMVHPAIYDDVKKKTEQS
ncbi:MAG: pantetheine-phosphate adenylyltransferase [Defluviitaleaceae bacterium]|nr:pantetheine-phosphate adenylyltransferase [Defluviitaleaceae bacterium]